MSQGLLEAPQAVDVEANICLWPRACRRRIAAVNLLMKDSSFLLGARASEWNSAIAACTTPMFFFWLNLAARSDRSLAAVGS
jgi:hypothetical protein